MCYKSYILHQAKSKFMGKLPWTPSATKTGLFELEQNI